MSSWFNRDDQALHGFAKYFGKASEEERSHGTKLTTMEWGTPLDALQSALELEKTVNESLLKLHVAAGNHGDAHLCDFLESNYLDEQVDGIKEIGDMITKLQRA